MQGTPSEGAFTMKRLGQLCLYFALALTPAAVPGQTNIIYLWTNFVGLAGGPGNVDGTNGAARFNRPQGLAVDAGGTVYVADTGNSTIRQITPVDTNQVVMTIAGFPGQTGTADGTNSAARFNQPCGLAVDAGSNVFVADTMNHTIRKLTPFGTNGWQVTTLAGRPGYPGSADGTGNAASFSYPRTVVVDGAGNLFVADNCTIRKVTSAGVVTTVAGYAGNCGCADGVGGAARFWAPAGLALDSQGSVWVADTANHVVRRVLGSGLVQTMAGACGIPGCTNGTLTAARFSSPAGIAINSVGTLFVADTGNNSIRVIGSSGAVTTLVGCGVAPNPLATNAPAPFNQPSSLAFDSVGNLYVADTFNNTIRRLTLVGTNLVSTTLAGGAGGAGYTDGTNNVRFNGPSGVAVDSAGTVYVADTTNGTLRKVTSAGVVSTLAGVPGSMGCAGFNQPNGLTVDTNGNLIVADTYNCVIRRVATNGVVTTLAGQCGVCGSTNGPGPAVQFMRPYGVTADTNGNIFVADTMNGTIRVVNSSGLVTPVAGSVGVSGTNDGPGMWASFSQPGGVAVDAFGNVYVADRTNHTIRVVNSSGVVTTLAGLGGVSGTNDGTGNAARFNFPTSVAVDNTGNVFVTDTGNGTIRRVTSTGVVTTIGGAPGMVGGSDGLGSGAAFSAPAAIAVDSAGSLWVVDANENRLIRGQPMVPVLTTKRQDNKIIVSWPAAYKGYVLQQNSAVPATGSWTASRYPIADNGTTKSITVTSPPPKLMFRLVGN